MYRVVKDKQIINNIEKLLSGEKIEYRKGKMWQADGVIYYRSLKDIIAGNTVGYVWGKILENKVYKSYIKIKRALREWRAF